VSCAEDTVSRADETSAELDTPAFCERHYSVAEVARAWAVSACTIKRIFEREPGVLHLDNPLTTRKRKYITLRIPASVLERVHDRMTAAR
jgi:hypothetical protein